MNAPLPACSPSEPRERHNWITRMSETTPNAAPMTPQLGNLIGFRTRVAASAGFFAVDLPALVAEADGNCTPEPVEGRGGTLFGT